MSQGSSPIPPKEYRPIGIILAVGSGVLIGSSFVFKKKGLLSSQKGKVAGEGLDYLKSVMWWTGMTIMILGEICNFAAYAFVEAIVVTPMGALSVVISAILSHMILKEKLSLFGWIGSIQCILGASILALNAPEEQSVSNIADFKKLFLAPGFLSWGSVTIVGSVVLAVWVAPKYGHKSMLPYIGVCSLVGGLSVSCIQGLGACILTTIRGENQFKNWFIYFLIAFVVVTLLTEIYYLNVALALFNTAMVTPTYYVTFTFCTLVTSVILYQGLKASARIIVTVVLAFLVICTGITILQMSKVDPRKLSNVDEHTTLLLEVAKQEPAPKASRELDSRSRSSALSSPRRRRRTTSSRSQAPSTMPLGVSHSVTDVESGASHVGDATLADSDSSDTEDIDIIVEKIEQPSLDSLRGTFGAIGTIIRNRRRTALAEAHDRSNTRSNIRNRRGSEASGLASQSINEEPRQPGEERDVEKLDLSRRYFGSGMRRPSEPTAPVLLNASPRDTNPQSTPSNLFPPSSTFSAEPPMLHSSPESEKSDPLATSSKRTPGLRAHFDPNEQPPSSRIQTSSPPPISNSPTSVRFQVDQPDQGLAGDKEEGSSA